MARAIILGFDSIANNANGTDDLTVRCVFTGSDLPAVIGVDMDTDVFAVNVNLSSDSNAQLATKIAAGVRARATARGFTVAANQLLAPSWVKG